MEVEKRGAKGGFFQLFDWNNKSRKKLFSGKSESPESSNLGKDNFYSSPIARHQQIKARENGFALGGRSHNDDYHYTSSESGDSEYETKAPGVVARLMGLDSLPKSTVNEPCVTPFIESHSFRDSSYVRAAPPFRNEHDIVIFESVRNKLDGFTRNPLELRLQKAHHRPIERFQSEVLPPKSAKPISIAHNRLLSPIKSPGFIPPKNAAYIIEAAAKIIEHSPRATNRGKLPSIGDSSIPFRVRDLKEKMEATQRSYQPGNTSQKVNEPSSAKHVRKPVSARGERQSESGYPYKGSEEPKRISSQRSKSKERSHSLAVQAKTNIQKRDGSTSVGYRSYDKQREHIDTKPSCDGRNIANTQKKKEKQISSRRSSEVLRPNHQKQNGVSGKDREHSEASSSNVREKTESNLANNFGRPHRTVNKIILVNEGLSRKTNLVAADPGKELSSSRTKTISKKKLLINENNQSEGSVSQKAEVIKDEESVACNPVFKGDSKWDTIDRKNGSDVVSFTFTSPIKKSGARSNYLYTGLSIPSYDPCVSESDLSSSAASCSAFNVSGGDSLSVLLDQKLKELASRVDFSQQDLSEAGSFSNSSYGHGKTGPSVNLANSLTMNLDICKGKQEMKSTSDCTSIDELWLNVKIENKGREYMEKDGNHITVEHQGRYNPLGLGFGSVSSLPSFSGASSYSCDVDRSSSSESSMQYVSLESYGGTTQKSHPAEGDAETSDTASSLSITTISEPLRSSLYMTDSKDLPYWELHYIFNILNSSDALMLEEFALGQAQKPIAPELFEILENCKTGPNKDTEERFLLERKVLFDCVGEFLEARSGPFIAGSWAKQSILLHKKQRLAEEIYREISGWTNDEEMMVDALVEKDMSCKNGKWVEFEVEAFEEGVEIEISILTSLVDELINGFLF